MKAHDLITSPAFIVIKAASEFTDKTTAINQLWQTEFTYLKVLGWGFPTDDAATKLIYLAIRNFEKAGRCVREWVAARNQFAILYPERFNK